MIKLTLTLLNPLGLHGRASSRLVDLARRYQSDITLQHGKQRSDAKSILGIMMLGAACGAECQCTIDGPDEAEAAQAIEAFFKAGLGDSMDE